MLDAFLEILRNSLSTISETSQNGWTFTAYLAATGAVLWVFVFILGGKDRVDERMNKRLENDPVSKKMADSFILRLLVYIWIFGWTALFFYLHNKGWEFLHIIGLFFLSTIAFMVLGAIAEKMYRTNIAKTKHSADQSIIVDQTGKPIKSVKNSKED